MSDSGLYRTVVLMAILAVLVLIFLVAAMSYRLAQ
jgi:uncharacterized membrane protein